MNNFFNTLIVKFASPCNLNCTYCYEYNTGDDSWKSKPKFISVEIAHLLNQRIKEFLIDSSLSKINVVAHGGEPLLLGAKRLNEIFSAISDGIEEKINFGMQTNAILVNNDIIDVLKKHDVKCGVSVDGNFEHHRHRVYHNGKPSFDDTIKGYHLLEQNNLVAGILCVVDFETNPIDVLDTLCGLNPKQLDLLQPFFNHDHTLGKDKLGELFFNWMGRAFEYYMSKPAWHHIKIRLFEAALFSFLSNKSNSDWFGGPHANYLVIESDGNYDLIDHLKSIGSFGKQISNLSMNLRENSFKDANNAIHDTYLRLNLTSSPDICKTCDLEKKCGGGYYPTRFSSVNNSLNNESVYCSGLKLLFNKISDLIKVENKE